MKTFTRLSIDIKGQLASYFELGSSLSSPTILILHGWGLSAYVYLKLAGLLVEAGFRIIVVDLPDFGFSFSPNEKWYFEDYADFISDFICQVVKKKVTVLGHSFGGGIGLALAARHGSLVEKLILVDSAGIPINLPVPIVGVKKILEMVLQSLLPGGFLPSMQMTWIFLINLFRNPLKIFRSIQLPNKQDLISTFAAH
jgi:pimeloyl-ACP methyl ester carboxylesterase